MYVGITRAQRTLTLTLRARAREVRQARALGAVALPVRGAGARRCRSRMGGIEAVVDAEADSRARAGRKKAATPGHAAAKAGDTTQARPRRR